MGNDIDSFHEHLVSLQHWRCQKRQQIKAADVFQGAKYMALAYVEEDYENQVAMLRSYFEVWE